MPWDVKFYTVSQNLFDIIKSLAYTLLLLQNHICYHTFKQFRAIPTVQNFFERMAHVWLISGRPCKTNCYECEAKQLP